MNAKWEELKKKLDAAEQKARKNPGHLAKVNPGYYLVLLQGALWDVFSREDGNWIAESDNGRNYSNAYPRLWQLKEEMGIA